jgi:hypothetical protein
VTLENREFTGVEMRQGVEGETGTLLDPGGALGDRESEEERGVSSQTEDAEWFIVVFELVLARAKANVPVLEGPRISFLDFESPKGLEPLTALSALDVTT